MILLAIKSVGLLSGNVLEAKVYVLQALKDNLPQVAPWIIKSIEKIVKTQLSGNSGFSWINFFLLGYASLGFLESLMFGISTITKTETKGGFIIETVKGFLNGAFLGVFLVTLL